MDFVGDADAFLRGDLPGLSHKVEEISKAGWNRFIG